MGTINLDWKNKNVKKTARHLFGNLRKPFLSAMSAESKAGNVHAMIQPLAWILGKWRAAKGGKGQYPNLDDFAYGEEVEFFCVGQPNVQFSSYSWSADAQKPMHREVGFIRIKPDSNKIALMSAQNIGVTDIEEGEVKEGELTVESTGLHRMSFSKEPETKKVVRTFRRTGDELTHIMSMQTSRTPLTEHLRITYKKVE